MLVVSRRAGRWPGRPRRRPSEQVCVRLSVCVCVQPPCCGLNLSAERAVNFGQARGVLPGGRPEFWACRRGILGEKPQMLTFCPVCARSVCALCSTVGAHCRHKRPMEAQISGLCAPNGATNPGLWRIVLVKGEWRPATWRPGGPPCCAARGHPPRRSTGACGAGGLVCACPSVRPSVWAAGFGVAASRLEELAEAPLGSQDRRRGNGRAGGVSVCMGEQWIRVAH